MRTVLVVSYSFLPLHSVGVRQFVGYCRYLPEFGWHPIVLTKDWERDGLAPEDAAETLTPAPELAAKLIGRAEIVRAPYRTRANTYLRVHERLQRWSAGTAPTVAALATPARRAWSLAYPAFGQYPDHQVGWVRSAVARGREIIRARGVSALLSSCPPVTNSIVAANLARATGVPWIPHFGDLYTFDIGEHQPYATALHRAWGAARHRRWMSAAARSLAVSPGMVRYLRDTYGVEGDVVVVGYDQEDFTACPPPAGETFQVAHVGSLYPFQRLDLLFDGLDALLRARPELIGAMRVRLVGSRRDDEIRAMVRDRACAAVVSIEPKVSPGDALAIQRASQALLLFPVDAAWNRTGYGTYSYPSKIFEYFGAERPILSVPADGDWVDALLRRTGTGVPAEDAGVVTATLARWYDEWSATGRVTWTGDRDEIRGFTHRAQAEVIARGLELATAGR